MSVVDKRDDIREGFLLVYLKFLHNTATQFGRADGTLLAQNFPQQLSYRPFGLVQRIIRGDQKDPFTNRLKRYICSDLKQNVRTGQSAPPV